MATEELKIKVKADTSQAESAFKKLRDSVVTFNQGLESVEKVVRTFKKAWDFTKEGAQFDSLAQRIDSKLVDKIQRAVNGTVTRLEIMKKISKEGAEQAMKDLKAQYDLLGSTEKAVLRLETTFNDFWTEQKRNIAEVVAGLALFHERLTSLSKMGTADTRAELVAAQRVSARMNGRLTAAQVLDLAKGRGISGEYGGFDEESARKRNLILQEYEKEVGARGPYSPSFDMQAGGNAYNFGQRPSSLMLTPEEIARRRRGAGPSPFGEASRIPTFGGTARWTGNGLANVSVGGSSVPGFTSPSEFLGGSGLRGMGSVAGASDLEQLKGQLNQLSQFGQEASSLTQQAVGAAIDAAIGGQENILKATKRAVAGQLRAKAVLWGMEAAAAGFMGNFVGATKLGALAVAAGAAAAVMGGGGAPAAQAVPGGGFARPGGFTGGNTPVVINVSGGSSAQNALAVQKAMQDAQRQGLLPSGGASRFRS